MSYCHSTLFYVILPFFVLFYVILPFFSISSHIAILLLLRHIAILLCFMSWCHFTLFYVILPFYSILANVSTVKDFVYVGGEDMTKEGTFRWINGEPVQGIPWAGGKPNNMGNADCLTMRQSNSFLFHDWQCLKFSVSKKLIQLRGRLENIQIINIHIDTSQN